MLKRKLLGKIKKRERKELEKLFFNNIELFFTVLKKTAASSQNQKFKKKAKKVETKRSKITQKFEKERRRLKKKIRKEDVEALWD